MFLGSISQGWGSLRMGQGRRVEGSGPHNSHPAAKGATPGKGDDVPARESMAITPGHGQKRRVK